MGDDKKIELAELNDIEVFEAGTYRGKVYDDAKLDEIVKNTNDFIDEIKPVAIIGHDEDQDLLKRSGLFSAGWMQPVKKVGQKIVASFKDVPQVLAELINKKAFKRISAEIYNDYNGKGLALRRVAILGGDIPEVKTLQDIAALYSDDARQDQTTWVTLSEAAPKSGPDVKAAEPATPAPATREETNMDITELAEKVIDLSEKVTKMEEEGKVKDDKIKALEAEHKDTVTKLSEVEQKKKAEDIDRFCMDLMRTGRTSPALLKLGLQQFMAGLDDNEVVKFGEGAKTYDLTPLGFMKKYFMSLPANSIIRFGEVAFGKPDAAAEDAGKTAADRLSEATNKIMAEADKAGKPLSYTVAFGEAQKANPELAKEYLADIGQPQQ